MSQSQLPGDFVFELGGILVTVSMHFGQDFCKPDDATGWVCSVCMVTLVANENHEVELL